MKYLAFMLLASIFVISCVPHEIIQYRTEQVVLVRINSDLRFDDEERQYKRTLTFVYRTERGYEFELKTPIDGSIIIGSSHMATLQR